MRKVLPKRLNVTVPVLFVLLFLALRSILLAEMKIQLQQVYTSSPAIQSTSQGVENGHQCFFSVKSYESSPWEQEWYLEREELQQRPAQLCQKLTEQQDIAKAWIQHTTLDQQLGSATDIDGKIFSKFLYENPCTKEQQHVYIEPLVANFRHPWGLPTCRPPPEQVDVQSRDYVLMHGMDRSTTEKLFPGKKYLFDLGTSWYGTSLHWFIDVYGKKGIEFDEIWAWEVTNLDPSKYWAEIPKSIKPKLHFYNEPVTPDANDPANPMNHIKRAARPGDFVVLKLDIDNSDVELQFIKAIEQDVVLRSRISEVMFEMHYNSEHINMYFGSSGGNTTWQQVFEQIYNLRKAGLKIHYWP